MTAGDLDTGSSPIAFTVGNYSCTVVSDGEITHLPGARNFYPAQDPAEVDGLMRDHGYSTERLVLAQNVLVVDTGTHRVVFDPGVGTDPAFGQRIFGTHTGRTIEHLRAVGVDPSTVDLVCVTHAHPDHCWGLATPEGEAAFPNAEVVIGGADHDYWNDLSKVSGQNRDVVNAHYEGAHRCFGPYRQRLVRVQDGDAPVPGISVIDASGHSPGQVAYKIESGGETLLLWGDVAHHPIPMLRRPDWRVLADADPARAVSTRHRIIGMAVEGDWLVLAYHFPFPGIGKVVVDGDAYSWHETGAP